MLRSTGGGDGVGGGENRGGCGGGGSVRGCAEAHACKVLRIVHRIPRIYHGHFLCKFMEKV